jgi:UDP:flavonoid glycosyltransferase YjiC (YdhE family)
VSRIVFSSAAFWGDVMPYVPIANELARRGHDVLYSLPAGHHEILAGERFALHDNGSRFTQHDVLADPAQLKMLERQHGSATGTAMVRYWAKKYIADDAEIWTDRTADVLQGADVMVVHPTAATLSAIPAIADDVPWVCGQLFPSMIPSAATDPAGIDLRLPDAVARRLRRLLWRVTPLLASPIMQDGVVNGVSPACSTAPAGGGCSSPAPPPPPTKWQGSTGSSSSHHSPRRSRAVRESSTRGVTAPPPRRCRLGCRRSPSRWDSTKSSTDGDSTSSAWAAW